MNSTLEWKQVEAGLPDNDRLVLIHMPTASEPVWLGYRSEADLDNESAFTCGEAGQAWHLPEGQVITDKITHWAELPAPPAN